MTSIEVRGHEQLADLGRRFKAAGDRGKGLRKQLLKEIRQVVKPVLPEIRSHAASILPKRGGLAAEVASAQLAVRTNLGPKSASVKVVSTSPGRFRDLNRGRLRHPVFGNREKWVQQSVWPGWFTDRIEARKPRMQGAVLQAMRQTAHEIERG